MKTKYALPSILAINVLVLLVQVGAISLSYDEAHVYFGYHGIAGYFSHLFVPLFGQNDYTVRLPMIFLHIFSTLLLYKISSFYLKKEQNRLLLVLVYVALPGVISASLLINDTGFIIFSLFFFVYLYKLFDDHFILYFYMAFLVFLGQPYFYLFLGVFFYALYNKKRSLALFSLFLAAANFFLFGSDIGGAPTGHFLDALGVYAAIFSPVVFVFLIYALYRAYLAKQRDLVWFLSTTALVFSLLLSVRQRVHLEIYAPYLLLGLVVAARTFESSYRVRLPQFRKRYRLLFGIALAFLALNLFAVLSNKFLYLFLENPKKHFAYKNHVAKELAMKLKQLDIKCARTDYKMQLRLEFYGIKKCDEYILLPYKTRNGKDVTISYNNKKVFHVYVTKLNSK